MSGGGESDEVTVTKNAEEFDDLAPIPYPANSHCVAAIDADMIFTTGLGDNQDESYMYHKDTGEWILLTNMPTGRNRMACGAVRDGSGQIEVVVVGGSVDLGGYDGLSTVEIYNIEEATWRTGK